jgi:uncharacterized membrane protein SirB2
VDADRFALAAATAVRVLPHLVDTVLLGSAIAMAMISAQYPFAVNWLTAKLIGLLIYIGCGTMAFKRARSKAQRACSWSPRLGCRLPTSYRCACSRSPLGLFRLARVKRRAPRFLPPLRRAGESSAFFKPAVLRMRTFL